MRRRAFLALGLGLLPLSAGCGTNRPRTGPPISLVVPTQAGAQGGPFARELKTLIERQRLAGKVEIRTRSGDAGARALARFAAGRDYDDLMVAGPALVAIAARNGLGGLIERTSPLARFAGEWVVLVTGPHSRFRTFDDLAAALIRDPSRLRLAGRDTGGPDHVLYGLTAQGLGIHPRSLNYVALPDLSQVLAATLDGSAVAGLGGRRELAADIRAGRVRPLAVSSLERLDGVDAPTLKESGVRLHYAHWTGLLGPGRLGGQERERLLDLCRAVSDLPGWAEVCRGNGWAPMFLDGDDFRQWLGTEARRTKVVLGELGLL
ncbi:tripartite tricarboxylate transporter substrate-binding protein [Microtetraspora sp. NBRC 16547]|uniref:Bug family tripartite tricarboxylate transporter substrate binding protein n=1 Tax=Microtetraspora sp. NBRC 16547 TaxID=3030993 RepID=UPI0024A27475|nr:tripartite tricarboxylate transporter substrate-binding protein [Microtetraspora sp. NBRC 16547]GLX01602.1 C4-dicarboxylate ABC transporter substrate-binding protein [Microtetraspora sp. NBRC 16547]